MGLFKQALTNFFETTTAHGCNRVCTTNQNSNLFSKLFWSLVLIAALIGMSFMMKLRIDSFREARKETTFINTIKLGENNSLEYPSFSICSEGFNTEFLSNDMLVVLGEQVKFYNDNPDVVLGKILSYDQEEDMAFLEKINSEDSSDHQPNFFTQALKPYINYAYTKAVSQPVTINGNDIPQAYSYLFENLECLNLTVTYDDIFEIDDNSLGGNEIANMKNIWKDTLAGTDTTGTIVNEIFPLENQIVEFCGRVDIKASSVDPTIPGINPTPPERIYYIEPQNASINFKPTISKNIFQTDSMKKSFQKLSELFAIQDFENGDWVISEQNNADVENKNDNTNDRYEEYKKYKNNTWFEVQIDKIIREESKYAQYYKPRNLLEVQEKMRTVELFVDSGQITTTAPTTTDANIVVTTNAPISTTTSPIPGLPKINFKFNNDKFNNQNIKFENFPESYEMPDHYSSLNNLKLSNTFSQNSTHVERMEHFGLIPENILHSLKIFGVDVLTSSLSNNKNSSAANATSAAKISKHVNFEGSCIRIDIDANSLRQVKTGPKNGIQVELTLPKVYDNNFEYFQSIAFPRRMERLSPSGVGLVGNDESSPGLLPTFQNDYYLMVYPSHINFPTTESLGSGWNGVIF